MLATLKKYNSLREQKKTIEAEMKKCSQEIQSYAESVGTKDAKGSYYVRENGFVFGKVAKKSITLNKERAVAYCQAHNLKDALKVDVTVDEDALSRLFQEGIISMTDMDGLTDQKIIYSVYVGQDETEEMPEVEETKIGTSAIKKFSVPKKARGN